MEEKKKETKRKNEKMQKPSNKSELKKDNKEKNTDKSNKNQKAKVKKEKSGKKIIVALIIIVILILLVLVFLYNAITPKFAVNLMLSNLKNGNKFIANLNVDYNNLITEIDSSLNSDSSEMSTLEKAFFSDLSWEIKNENIQDSVATVTVDITNKDYRQVLLNWIDKISKVIEQQDNISHEQYFQLLEESLQNVETTQNEVILNVTRDGILWKVNVDDNLIDGLFPGLNRMLDVLEQLSKDVE